MAKEKLIGVQWIARSYLADTEFMDKDVEGTYFRLINYIYMTQDRLEDDDTKLWQRCKCTSLKQYRAHKMELLKPRGADPETGEEIPSRVYVEGGYIRSPKCTLQLGKSSKFRQAKSRGGKASSEKRKYLKNRNTRGHSVGTNGSTESQHNVQHIGQQTTQQKNSYVEHNLKDIPSEYHPLTPLPHPSGPGGGLVTPLSRTSPPPAKDPEVDVGNNVIMSIDSNGICDLITAPRDAEIPSFTKDAALAMRAAALAPKRTHAPQTNASAPPPTERDWDAIAKVYVKSGRKHWPTHTVAGFPLGPSPDEPGCFCPKFLIKAAELEEAMRQPEMQVG